MVFNTISLFIKKKKDKQILGLWSHSSTVYHLTNGSLLFQGFMVPYLTFKSVIFFFFFFCGMGGGLIRMNQH